MVNLFPMTKIYRKDDSTEQTSLSGNKWMELKPCDQTRNLAV